MSAPLTISADWLAARVREENSCLVWTGYSDRGQPKTNLGPRSDRRPVGVRRLVWASAGNALLSGHEVICTCGTEDCVALEHLRQVTRKKRMEIQRAGKPRDSVGKVRAMLTRRARSKISDDAVQQIRDSQETCRALAERFGCSVAYVHMLRRGEFRQHLGNPFAGLGARG